MEDRERRVWVGLCLYRRKSVFDAIQNNQTVAQFTVSLSALIEFRASESLPISQNR